MPLSPRFSERLTAVISTLVAAALLAAGVSAQQERTARPTTLERLESDLRFQIRSAFRMTPVQAEQRLRELDAVLDDYRSQTRNAADQRVLVDWLAEATTRSMPGSIKPMPAAPEYSQELATRLQQESKLVKIAKQNQPAAPPMTPTLAIGEESLISIAPPLEIGVPLAAEKSILKQRKPVELPEKISLPEIIERPKVVQRKMVSEPAPKMSIEPVKSLPATQLVSMADKPEAPEPPAKPVLINVRELEARIAGYHAGLDELEAASIDSPAPTEQQIAEQIDLLESLVSDYQFVKLYYESLNPEERHYVSAPRKLREVFSATRKQLRSLQENVESDFLGEYDRSLGRRLAKLSKRLDSLAVQAKW